MNRFLLLGLLPIAAVAAETPRSTATMLVPGFTVRELPAQPGGAVAKLKKTDIAKTEPMNISLMPPGLDKTLTAPELRDLMTFLLTTPLESAKL